MSSDSLSVLASAPGSVAGTAIVARPRQRELGEEAGDIERVGHANDPVCWFGCDGHGGTAGKLYNIGTAISTR
eukprot:537491-Heterocapsa_arctica.AAC.1